MKLFKWASIIIGSIIAVVLLVTLVIQFYLDTEQARRWIQAKVNQAIPGTITWNQNRFSILGGKLELNHVLLTGPEKDKLIELERLSVHISYARLLKWELYIHELFLENPEIFLVKDRRGNLNLIQALYTSEDKPSESGQSDGSMFNILLSRLSVANGFVQYDAAEKTAENKAEHAVFKGVNLTITDGNLFAKSGRLSCQIAGGKIQSKGTRIPVERISLKADVREDRVDVLYLDANMDGLSANITGTIDNLFTDNPIFLDLGLESRASLTKIKDIMKLEPDFSGEVQVNSNLKGTLDNPDFGVKLIYDGGKLAGNSIGRIHLNCHLKDRSLNISDLNLYTLVGKFDIKGDIDFKKAFAEGLLTPDPDLDAVNYKFFILQTDTQLDKLSQGISGLKGVARSEMELEGRGIYPKTLLAKSSLRLYINDLSSRDAGSSLNVHVSAQANMEKGRITIQDLTAAAGGSRFEMSGNFNVSSHQVAAHFNLEASDLAEATTSFGMKGVLGKIQLNGNVSGTSRELSLDAKLSGKDLGYGNIEFGEAYGNIRFVNGRFSLMSGKILNGNSRLDISGFARIFDQKDYQLLEYPDVDVQLQGDTFFLEDFVQGMKGQFTLNGRVKGRTGYPKGKIDLSGKNVDLSFQHIDEINLKSVIDGPRIYFDSLSLAIVPGEKILLNGWVSTHKHYDISINSTDISLKNIKKMASLKTDSEKISLDISGKGEFENPQLKGKIVLSGFGFNNQRLGKIPFEFKVENQVAYLSGGLNFTLDATYGYQSRSFSTTARFDNTDLTPYLQFAGKKDLNGAITGTVELKGNLGTPIRMDGTVRISRLTAFWKDTPLIRGNEIVLLVHDGDISIPGMRLSLADRGFIALKGSGKLNGDLNLEADGSIPFEILPMFTDAISDATGEMRFSLKMNGGPSTPDITIHGDINDAGISVPVLFQKFQHINGDVRITSDAIILDGINGMLDTGNFELKGVIDLVRYQPSNIGLKLKVDNLPLSIPDLLDIRLNSELDVQGSLEKSMIKGDIELIEGTYEKDFRLNLMENIGQGSREKPPVTSKTPWPIFDNMAIDCKIRYKDPFVIDNNIALLAIKPDLYIHGTVNRPLVSGRAEVESGTVYFQRNEFNVIKGIFDFINPYKIEPTVDIKSEVKIREWTVSLEISGAPDNLNIEMNSDPPERDEDIISLLISGKTSRELIAREGGGTLSPKQMLADVLTDTVQKDIKDATGLDLVALEYNEAKDAEASDEIKVTLGKDLSRRMTVKYDVQTKNAKVIRKVITEYKLLEKLIMNAFQDTEGQYGGGISFRLEFR